MVTISTVTLYPLLLSAWTISMQYLTITFSSFSGNFLETLITLIPRTMSLISKNYIQ